MANYQSYIDYSKYIRVQYFSMQNFSKFDQAIFGSLNLVYFTREKNFN